VPPNERDEPGRRDGSTLQRLASSDDEREHLRVSLTQRCEEPSPFGQLPKERLRHLW
jgi:hypothetical protein